MMKNRFLGMKMGSRTRPDHPRPRKTRKTDRKPRKTRKIEKFGVGGRREAPSISLVRARRGGGYMIGVRGQEAQMQTRDFC